MFVLLTQNNIGQSGHFLERSNLTGMAARLDHERGAQGSLYGAKQRKRHVQADALRVTRLPCRTTTRNIKPETRKNSPHPLRLARVRTPLRVPHRPTHDEGGRDEDEVFDDVLPLQR